jgi:hypothetical protein
VHRHKAVDAELGQAPHDAVELARLRQRVDDGERRTGPCHEGLGLQPKRDLVADGLHPSLIDRPGAVGEADRITRRRPQRPSQVVGFVAAEHRLVADDVAGLHEEVRTLHGTSGA